jgi:hypothetical protein
MHRACEVILCWSEDVGEQISTRRGQEW